MTEQKIDLDDVAINIYSDGDVTIATVEVETPNGRYVKEAGSAKMAPGEIFNFHIGATIALGRAFQKFGAEVERIGLDSSELACRIAKHERIEAKRRAGEAKTARAQLEAKWRRAATYAQALEDAGLAEKNPKPDPLVFASDETKSANRVDFCAPLYANLQAERVPGVVMHTTEPRFLRYGDPAFITTERPRQVDPNPSPLTALLNSFKKKSEY